MSVVHIHRRGGVQRIDGSGAAWAGAIVTFFLVGAVITYGYANYASALRPDLHPGLAVAVGVVVALIAIVLARAAATARLLAREDGAPRPWLAGVAWFIPLLLISAVGAMNSMFYLFETDDVVTQRLATAQAQLVSLSVKGREQLAHPEIEPVRSVIASSLKDLQLHIERGGATPNSCGIGVDARADIRAIQKVLPGYGEVTRFEGVNDCRKTEILRRLYTEQETGAWDRFHNLPVYVQNHGADREVVARGLESSVAELSKGLKNPGNMSPAQLAAIQQNLRAAAAAYADLKTKVEELTGKPLSIAATMDIDDVLTAGNAGHVVKNLLKRWDHLQTWGYIALALFLDGWLVYAYGNLLKHRHRLPAQKKPEAESVDTEVRYLWDEKAA